MRIPTLSEVNFEIEKRKRARERSQYADKLKSKKFRMENLYQIVDKSGKAIHFKMNREQKEIYDNTWADDGSMINSPKVLKSRQIGVSTLFVLSYLDDALNIPNINCYIQSHKDDSIEKIFRIVRFAYDNLPDDYKPIIGKGGGSKYELYFPTLNSRIYVGLENRSNTIHRVHFSEMAFQEKAKVAATLGALPINQKYSVETTPNGLNWFHDDWIGTEINKYFYPWFSHAANILLNVNTGPYTDDEQELIDKYNLTREQIEFRRAKIASFPNKDIRLFLQEYPEDEQSCFLLSGSPVISLQTIKRLQTEVKKPIYEKNGIKIYRELDKSRRYVCGADVAEGFSKDWSSAVILDDQRNECASYRGKIRPSDYAHKLIEMCDMFELPSGQHPLLAVENNNHGHAVLLEIEEHIHYSNLFYYKEGRVGWLTDRVTRPIMISALIDAIENGTIDFCDQVFVNECLTLIDNSGKIEAATGQNDDSIMSRAIAVQMLAYVVRQTAYDDPSKYILL